MAKVPKKAKESDLFFNERILYEEAFLALEKSILDQNPIWERLRKHIAEMKRIAEENGSVYFYHRVQKLELFTEKYFLKKSYKKAEFDSVYRVLEKIKNQDKIEFLDSAIKNRIGKVAHGIQETQKTDKAVSPKERYIAFRIDSLHFLLPAHPFRVLPEVPAYHSKIQVGKKIVPLFPGAGFAGREDLIEPGQKVQKKILLVLHSKEEWEGFYFDELEEEWEVEPGTLEHKLTLQHRPHQKIWGTLRKKGKTYYLLKVPRGRND